jgi:hypothetical protein
VTPGTILFDQKFRFGDGATGKKLFVALTDGSSGIYVCVKATSRAHRYGLTAGCQAAERFPNFFVPKHASCLSENTWIQLEEFFEFDQAALIQKVMTRAIDRIGVLDEAMTRSLIICATHSDDLTPFQEQELTRQLSELAKAAPEKVTTL